MVRRKFRANRWGAAAKWIERHGLERCEHNTQPKGGGELGPNEQELLSRISLGRYPTSHSVIGPGGRPWMVWGPKTKEANSDVSAQADCRFGGGSRRSFRGREPGFDVARGEHGAQRPRAQPVHG